MGKYKILIDGVKLDGKEIAKGEAVELQWQTGDFYVNRGWAERVGESDAGNDGGSQKVSKRHK